MLRKNFVGRLIAGSCLMAPLLAGTALPAVAADSVDRTALDKVLQTADGALVQWIEAQASSGQTAGLPVQPAIEVRPEPPKATPETPAFDPGTAAADALIRSVVGLVFSVVACGFVGLCF